jgi:hypothetical protein
MPPRSLTASSQARKPEAGHVIERAQRRRTSATEVEKSVEHMDAGINAALSNLQGLREHLHGYRRGQP